MDLIVHLKAAHINALSLSLGLKESSEHIIADFSDESSFLSGFVQHSKNIAGSSAGIRLKQVVALFTQAVLCKVDQKFSKRCYINFLFNAHISITLSGQLKRVKE